jgi:hypothetical protein
MINYKKYMRMKDPDKAHALLSASGSERWLNCAASVALSKDAPRSEDSEASIAGTNTHTLLEFLLKEGFHAPLSEEFKKFIGYSPPQHLCANIAWRFIIGERKKLHKKYGVKPILLAEQKVELAGVGFGTSDVIMYIPGKVLWVMDYKNGKTKVDPEYNTQGLYYAVAAWKKFKCDFEMVNITIIQPNAASSRGPIRTWSTDVETLREADRRFTKGAKLALSPAGATQFKYDNKWCYFCVAKNQCPEMAERLSGRIKDRF